MSKNQKDTRTWSTPWPVKIERIPKAKLHAKHGRRSATRRRTATLIPLLQLLQDAPSSARLFPFPLFHSFHSALLPFSSPPPFPPASPHQPLGPRSPEAEMQVGAPLARPRASNGEGEEWPWIQWFRSGERFAFLGGTVVLLYPPLSL